MLFAGLLAWGAAGYGYLLFRREGLGARYVPLSRAEFDALGIRPFALRADSLFFRSLAVGAGVLPSDSVAEAALRVLLHATVGSQ